MQNYFSKYIVENFDGPNAAIKSTSYRDQHVTSDEIYIHKVYKKV
jgi:hypothetical protein